MRVLVDAFGSITLLDHYWDPLRHAGAQVRWFNPLSLQRFNVRDHRKLLVCDESLAVVGGFNVAPVCHGDGVNCGWRDLGMALHGPLVRELAASFDVMFDLADFPHRRFSRLRKPQARALFKSESAELLTSGPGRGHNPIRRALIRDLATARRVRIVAAYFLPPPRLRRAFSRVARRGGQVEIILPGKSDIVLMQAAGRGLYQRLLRARVHLYEYQPQVLHTKFIQIDNAVYVGSANLDVRSLSINYELLLRITLPAVVTEAQSVFDEHLAFSKAIDPHAWPKSRTFWNKLIERWAAFLFTRIDPYVTRRQLQGLR